MISAFDLLKAMNEEACKSTITLAAMHSEREEYRD